jgi:hypothetical protein
MQMVRFVQMYWDMARKSIDSWMAEDLIPASMLNHTARSFLPDRHDLSRAGGLETYSGLGSLPALALAFPNPANPSHPLPGDREGVLRVRGEPATDNCHCRPGVDRQLGIAHTGRGVRHGSSPVFA